MRPNSGRNCSSEGPTYDTVEQMRRQCRVSSAMFAPQRDGIRGAVCCLNLFLFPCVWYSRVCPVFCVLPAFRACVSSRVTVCCSNLQFILAVPEDGTQICKH